MRKVLALLLLGACTIDNSWGYGMKLDPGTDDIWSGRVVRAASEWDVALEPCMDMGLAIGVEAGGHPIRLVGPCDLEPDVAGIFNGDNIRVRTGLANWENGVILHEMGHALGFHHISESVDPDSIMNPSTGPDMKISEGDVQRALEMFGCR